VNWSDLLSELTLKQVKISVVFFMGGFTLTFSIESEGLVNPKMQSETWEYEHISSQTDFYEWKLHSSDTFVVYQHTNLVDVILHSS
jgi:hypothetical protein